MNIGLDPDRFWGLAPKQASAEIKAAVERQRRHHDELAWVAWHTAALHRIDKMPSLREFMGHKPRERDWREIGAELTAWAKSTNDNREQG